jgi:hypothetical protein
LVNRKKRLRKGIKSMEGQIEIHQVKRKQALEEGNIERAEYYDKEIASIGKDKGKKEKQLLREK